ncbi:MAG: GYD domain-containing protein [Alphaproteobacteria bacterium]|nr:GYD domain-containing protein [Alphaproteobacteria bacterium]
MAKYLIEARYTIEGAKGIVREGGSGRRAAITKTIEAVGGKVEAFYFAFGEVDAYVIIDMPDHVTTAAVGLAVAQGGGASVRTIVLITPEDMDKAAKKAVDYRPPGR